VVILIAIVVLALVFDYTNGFHDSANAIATSVSTRALSPRTAVLMAAGFNLLGALVSTNVASTVGKGIVNTDLVTLPLVLAALVGAVVWNLTTWYFALPSSSSQALFGGLIGAMIAAVGVSGVEWSGVVDKIVLPMVLSPVIGFGAAWLLMMILIWIVRRRPLAPVNHTFRRLQPFSAAFMAYAHGGNDAQKTMGVITLALVSSGQISTFTIPLWVKLACAITMAAGTYSGGWRIMHTLGSKVIKLDPIHGFAAETSAATVIQLATHFGFPVSTTHTITAAIMGVGATRRLKAVRWGVARSIVFAWVLTLPAAALVAAGVYLAGQAIRSLF
jgi:PiT family inorganic phosphate transporter